MKRFAMLMVVCVLMFGVICMPASAESAASKIETYCTVNAEGDCVVSMTVTLRLEAATNTLSFPLPANARDISMNGAAVKTTQTESATLVDISKVVTGMVGEFSMRFDYTIPEAVAVSTEEVEPGQKRDLILTIPLLSGFEYPVEKLTFTITMPSSAMTHNPTFFSTYLQDSMESSMNFQVSGSQIIGATSATMNDHEAVTMTMVVPTAMFPTVSTYVREGNPELIPMGIFAGLALLYWLIFLRNGPMRKQRTSTPPEGLNAGELGCRLTLCGIDLTMMVFTWARLGYVLIHLDGNGRVILHKRMEMGNERSRLEMKIFKTLFGSRRMVDATGDRYAKLCIKVSGVIPSARNMYKNNSGNMKIYRWLCCVVHLLCGVCVAMNMTGALALQILLAIVFAVFGAVSAWLIQDIAYRTFLRGKVPVYIGLVCVLIWIVLGILCGQVWIPLVSTLVQLLFGYLAAYGGRRSDLGRHDAAQVLGLRHYVKRLPREDISRLLNNDPDYYFHLAPYALALGVIKPYSAAFGRRMMDQCPYLISRVQGKRTAEDWGRLLEETANLMDAKSRRMMVEKWTKLPAMPVWVVKRKSTPKTKAKTANK